MGADEPRSNLPDAAARERAVRDFDTNLVVRAGAGTGKTSLLVERVLNAIGSNVATMESIAAITFTEKAAGEMRERLATGLDRLRALADGGGDLDHGKEADRAYRYLTETAGLPATTIADRALAAMERLDQGTVVTIHRFCAELLRSWPLEAGVDPAFVVDSGEWMESLSRREWEAFVHRELGPGSPPAEDWDPLLARISIGALGDAARALAGFGVPSALIDASTVRDGETLLAAEATRVAQAVEQWLARGTDLTPTARNCFVGFQEALEALASSGLTGCREALARNADLAERIAANRLGGASKAAGEEAAAEVKRVTSEARNLLRAVSSTDDETIARLLRVVSPFVAAYRESYLRSGFVGFDGLLSLTRDLLRDAPQVRRALKQRYRLLLVDEFQDTDPLQYEIVLWLAERRADAASDAFDARLDPGRLFVVGDAKQSVYRFRGADFSAYRRAIERIVATGGVELELVGNFRSVAGIVDPVNVLFQATDGCWQTSPYQPPYEPIHAVRPAGGDAPAVELWTAEIPPGARAEERREAEGRIIAEAIERWVGEKSHEYKKITLLFRAFTNITYYLRPLHERGIPFVVDGGRDFLRRPEVAQLVATLKALGRPADQPALLAYLRSPAGGASDVELTRYATAGGDWSWTEQPDPEPFPRISAAFETMRGLRSEVGNLPADALVRRVVERTLLLPLGAAAFEGPQRVANLQKLAAAAGDLARDGTLSLAEVIDALEQGRLEEIQTDRPLADDAAEAVRITSIHRMKGLENDVVIVPDLARLHASGQRASDDVALATMPDGRQTLALRVGGVRNGARGWYELEDGRHQQAEEVRVLYVALTRASRRLILLAAPTRETPWLDALAAWGYDRSSPPADGAALDGGRVLHRSLRAPARPRPVEAERPEEASQAALAYDAARRALQGAARPAFAAPSALHDGRAKPHDREGASHASGGRDVGMAVGIVMHRLLEGWDGTAPESLRRRLPTLCEEAAAERRADSEKVEREAREILELFVAGELARRFAAVERIGAELPLLCRGGEKAPAFRGTIDLLYRDADGRIVVADFKTDRTTDARELREAYGDQLAVYADAVREAMELGEPPRRELWLLRTGEILPLDDPPSSDEQRSGQRSLW